MTVFSGNVIDMLISGSHIVAEPASEFFVYAFLMIVVIGLFILLASQYTYAEDRDVITKYAEKQNQSINLENSSEKQLSASKSSL